MRLNLASIPPRNRFRSCVKKLCYLTSVDPSAALYDIDSVRQCGGLRWDRLGLLGRRLPGGLLRHPEGYLREVLLLAAHG